MVVGIYHFVCYFPGIPVITRYILNLFRNFKYVGWFLTSRGILFVCF